MEQTFNNSGHEDQTILYFIQVEISEYNIHMDCRSDHVYLTFVKATNIEEAKCEYEKITGDVFLEKDFIEDTEDEYITKKYKVIQKKYGESIINSSNEFDISR